MLIFAHLFPGFGSRVYVFAWLQATRLRAVLSLSLHQESDPSLLPASHPHLPGRLLFIFQ